MARTMAACLLAALAGCGKDEPSPAEPRLPAPRPPEADVGAREHVVRILEARFEPARQEARAGDTVVWRNESSAEHAVTETAPADGGGDRFDSGPIPPGRSFRHTVREPGLRPYHCRLHPDDGMTGALAVKAVAEAK